MTLTVYPDIEAARRAGAWPAHARGGCLFSTPEWLALFQAEILAATDEARVYTARGAGAGTGAVLPLWAVRPGPRRLRALANFYSSLFEPVADATDGDAAGTLAAIVEAVCAESPSWSAIDLAPMDPSAPHFDALERAFRGAGWITQRYHCFANWYLAADGVDYPAYLESRPSRLRNTLRRRERRLAREHTARFEVLQSPGDLDAALAAFEALYAQTWKPAEQYPGFVPALVRRAAALGWLRFGTLHVDDRLAAAQIWFVHAGCAYIFKLAHDPSLDWSSPGTLLTAHLMQHVLDVDRVKEVDFLTGDDAYKADWMSHCRERSGLLALNPRTLAGAAAAARHLGGRAVRTLLGRARGLPH